MANFITRPRIQLVWKRAFDQLTPSAADLPDTAEIQDVDSALEPIDVEPLLRAVLVFGDMPADVQAPLRTRCRATL
jgi:hypothetical protein